MVLSAIFTNLDATPDNDVHVFEVAEQIHDAEYDQTTARQSLGTTIVQISASDSSTPKNTVYDWQTSEFSTAGAAVYLQTTISGQAVSGQRPQSGATVRVPGF
jgi:hypothetical protein